MSGGVPAGWVLVPVECTDDIAEAIAFTASVCGGIAESTWREALAAARATPTPPSRDADVERVIETVLYRSSLNGTTAQIDETAREIAAALQALGERG